MKKPLQIRCRFLRFLAKPLLSIILLFTFVSFAQAQTGGILQDCFCLSNQTTPGNGQFVTNLVVTGAPAGQTWYISSVEGLYSMTSPNPPANPVPFTTGPGGATMTENIDGNYYFNGIHVDGLGFSITFTNGVITLPPITLAAGSCTYPNSPITGDFSVCEQQTQSYSVPFVGGSYLWTLASGGSFATVNTNNSVTVDWSINDPGPHALSLTQTNNLNCTVTRSRLVTIEDTLAMACNDSVQISLSPTCNDQLVADMFLEGYQYENDSYSIFFETTSGVPVAGNTINTSHLWQTFVVTVQHRCSGNMCWSYMTVVEKREPGLIGSVDTLSCFERIEPEFTGFPVDTISTVKIGDRKYLVEAVGYCAPITLQYEDTVEQQPCSSEFASIITRRWWLNDVACGSESCNDILKLQRTGINLLQFPKSWDGVAGNNPILESCGSWTKLPNGHPDPDYTGSPYGPNCGNIEIEYTDVKLPLCGANSFKILRKWLVMDWCNSEIFDTNQVIVVMDRIDPAVVAIPDQTYSAGINECGGDVVLPSPVVTDCNSWTYTVGYQLADKNGNQPPAPEPYITDARVRKNPNGTYSLLNLPGGPTWVKYTITDACGNHTDVFFKVTVVDLQKPQAICDREVVVSLDEFGKGYALAETFDDGSWDNCSAVTFKARRGSNSCGFPANTYRDGVEFCCADVGKQTMVELLVTDEEGLTNSCMSTVEVQDHRVPNMTCPPDITVSCKFDLTNLDVFGTVVNSAAAAKQIKINDPGNPTVGPNYIWGYDGVATDNCSTNISVVSTVFNLNDCGLGTIVRTFKATDPQGNFTTCSQTIRVINFTPFNANSTAFVRWPADHTVNGCIGADVLPDVLPAGKQRPVIVNDECALVEFTYSDLVFQYVDNYCYKIVRTWKMIDWCQFDTQDPFKKGYWEHHQLIMVNDLTPPKFITGCNPVTTGQINDLDCSATLSLSATASDNCTSTENLDWRYEIDFFKDNSVNKTGISNSITSNFPYGAHKITWFVTDECGNETSCSSNFTLYDRKAPTPVCYDGLVTVPMQSTGTVEIYAKSFNICSGCDNGSFDNCTPGDQLKFSYSSNVNNVSRIFSCADIANGVIDTIEIQMWVTDLAGNQDFCTANLILQDNQNVCPDALPERYDIVGKITDNKGQKLPSVEVILEVDRSTESKYTTTDDYGVYFYPQMNEGRSYKIIPQSDSDPKEGLSTLDLILIQQHLLGIKLLDTPEKLIASDANNSGSISAADIFDLRRLILGAIEQLPKNKSWRFIPTDEVFMDQSNPFPFVEHIFLTDFYSHSVQNNFKGIKVGDINQSYTPLVQDNYVSNRNIEKINLVVNNDGFAREQMVYATFEADRDLLTAGLQLTLKFNADVLSLDEIISGLMHLDAQHYNISRKQEGLITISWNDGNGIQLNEGDVLFTIAFKALRNGVLSDALSMNSQITDAEIYPLINGSLVENRLDIQFSNGLATDEQFQLFQNTPNPFTHETTIKYFVPELSTATLTIFDMNGKKMLTRSQESKGYDEFYLSIESDKLTPGIYMYTLEAGTNKSSKRMIMIK